MDDREHALIQEQLRMQGEEQERRFRARNEANLYLEQILLNVQLPINLSLLRKALAAQQKIDDISYYGGCGGLKGKDYVSTFVENPDFRLLVSLESDPESLEVKRLVKINELAVLYQGYRFSPQFLAGAVGKLVSPKQEITIPYKRKGRCPAFYFPDSQLTEEQYTFRFEPTPDLKFSRIPFEADENLPQDYL
jgi:hypothetical protein